MVVTHPAQRGSNGSQEHPEKGQMFYFNMGAIQQQDAIFFTTGFGKR